MESIEHIDEITVKCDEEERDEAEEPLLGINQVNTVVFIEDEQEDNSIIDLYIRCQKVERERL